MVELLKKRLATDIGKSVLSLIPLELRLGKNYRKKKSLIKKAENWNNLELRDWQYSKLRNLLYLAYNSSSGYHELYSSHGVHPRDLRSIDDLKYFPVVNKELLSSNIETYSEHRELRELRLNFGRRMGILLNLLSSMILGKNLVTVQIN